MLIGREREKSELLRLVEREESQFCVVYGRRRVGKTYLIRESFNYRFTFQYTGIANATNKQQLKSFRDALQTAGMGKQRLPKDWFEAFHLLSDFLDSLPKNEKKVVFIDELAWMDAPRSRMVSALESFWNGWVMAYMPRNVIFIVCASASSWITKNIFNNRGGLHNRATARIYVRPFTLNECEQYVRAQQLSMTRRDIIDAYMIFGGIPYYWNYLRREYSLAQNIDNIFFTEQAVLKNEYNELYRSLYNNPQMHMTIVETLGKKKVGMTREEIVQFTGIENSGDLTKVLMELEQCDFIRSYYSFGKNKYGMLYQLMDNYTLFYFQFIESNVHHNTHYWSEMLNSRLHSTWAGLSFERVCLQHTDQIKKALGIWGVSTSVGAWHVRANEEHEGAQVDLLIDRGDNVINLCEMKYYDGEYVITKEEDMRLRNRAGLFQRLTKTRKAIRLTMITSFGLSHNMYWSCVHNELTADCLFEK